MTAEVGANSEVYRMTSQRLRVARLLAVALIALAAISTACSPESSRQQGGGMGADVGNRPQAVEVHGQTNMYYGTPRLLPASR